MNIRNQKSEIKNDSAALNRRRGVSTVWLRGASMLLAVALSASAFMAAPARAATPPTQEDVFKSISSSVDQPTDSRKVVAAAITIAAVMVLLMVFGRRQTRAALPQKLNHPGKLIKELMKTAGLTRGQAKALKARADQMAAQGRPLDSPITLLLCPSLSEKSQ
jgi:type IV secretory pathway VirB2 component (pilin)